MRERSVCAGFCQRFGSISEAPFAGCLRHNSVVMRILLVLPAGVQVRVTKERPEVPGREMLRFSVLPLAIVAALTPPEHQARIADENVQPLGLDSDVDVVGVTFMTALAPRACEIARQFRARGWVSRIVHWHRDRERGKPGGDGQAVQRQPPLPGALAEDPPPGHWRGGGHDRRARQGRLRRVRMPSAILAADANRWTPTQHPHTASRQAVVQRPRAGGPPDGR
jgi:hypothetical protein